MVARLHRLTKAVSRKRDLDRATLLTNNFDTNDPKIKNFKTTEDLTYKKVAEDLATELQVHKKKNSRELNHCKKKI